MSDIKNLKDLSKVIVLPLLCACYLFQTDFLLDIDGWIFAVNPNANFTVQATQSFLIFLAKTLWASFICFGIYFSIVYCNIFIHESIIPITVLLLLTFGFLGVFSPEKIELTKGINSIWYYSCFVVAFFLLSMQDEIKNGK